MVPSKACLQLVEALKGRTKGKDRIEVLSVLLEGILFITSPFVLFSSVFSLFLVVSVGSVLTEYCRGTECSKFASFSEEDLVCVPRCLGCWVWWIRVFVVTFWICCLCWRFGLFEWFRSVIADVYSIVLFGSFGGVVE
ncbi:hypothetical protein KFK09_002726 [Dendrobium nobile]|uniref:Transmembrane protein n=1 Tax=Dendrobium nobile TaxID=94219 RepID=A0A8T3C4G7_DENNO|nr:hypothetical protein KFK09_002726 [Dendrobium nobile]